MEGFFENYKCLLFHFINVVISSSLIELGLSGWQNRPFEKKKWWCVMLVMTGISVLIR